MQGIYQGCPFSMLLYIIAAEDLPISLLKIKEIQIGDHEIKIINFADNMTIFIRDFTCLSRIQVILKLCQDAFRSMINFSKVKPYGQEHIKLELINQDKWNNHNITLKYLELILVTLS